MIATGERAVSAKTFAVAASMVVLMGTAAAAPVWDQRPGLGQLNAAPGNQAAMRSQAERVAGGVLGAAAGDLKASNSAIDQFGSSHVRMQQFHQGKRVYGADLVLHSRANGVAYLLNGNFVRTAGAPASPKLSADSALAGAAADLGLAGYQAIGAPELAYAVGRDGDSVHLVWRTLVEYGGKSGIARDYVMADALTGAFVRVEPTIMTAKTWRTYDANRAVYSSTSLPGTLLCSNTGSCPNADAQSAHDGAGDTYDYYFNKFGRRSVDNNDLALISSINVCGSNNCTTWNNAAWIGTQMVYGNGDGSTFTSGSLARGYDVTSHELTHGVTDFSSNLVYQNASGALNEAMSDILGASAEAYRDGAVSSNTWKIGEAIYTPSISGDALRYMDNPTLDGYSRDYYPERIPETSNPTGNNDYGGVHGNSGIFNLAYYLLSQGGTHPRGKTTNTVVGVGISKAEQIFYRANTVYYTSSTGYTQAAQGAAQAALDLYGAAEQQSVIDAFCAVGVGTTCGGGTGGDTTPPVISNVSSRRISGGTFRVTWTTNEPATSVVRIPAYNFTNSNSALVTSHSLSQTGTRRVTYTYYVDSVDAAGNIATAGPFTHRN